MVFARSAAYCCFRMFWCVQSRNEAGEPTTTTTQRCSLLTDSSMYACLRAVLVVNSLYCMYMCVCVCVCVCCVVCMSGAGSLVHLEKVYITFSCVVIPLYYPGSDNLIAMFCVHWLVQPQVWFIVVCLVCVQLM